MSAYALVEIDFFQRITVSKRGDSLFWYTEAAQSPAGEHLQAIIGGLLQFSLACHTRALSVSNFDLSNCSGGGNKRLLPPLRGPPPSRGRLRYHRFG